MKRVWVWISLSNVFIIGLVDTIDAFTEDKKDAGHLKLEVYYDKSQLYVGEVNSLKQQNQNNDYLKLYMGKCKSRNLFSMMDESAEGQNEEVKFVESIYRDNEWNKNLDLRSSIF